MNILPGISEHQEPVIPLKKALLAIAIASALGAAPAAMAQEGDAEETEALLEEVLVTATRRENNILDVPISVTALTGEELDLLGALDITYLAQQSPNTTLEVSRGTNTTLTAFMRGVGQQDPVAGFESGVGIYLDDVYLNRPQAAILDIYDVERIEVLRGPQGTLYGRNTIGGAIKYVTRRLAPVPEAKFRVNAGTDGLLDGIVTGSLPIGDRFRIGASVASFNRDGFGDNLNLPGIENYNKKVLGARFSAEWDATDNLFFRLSGDMVEDESDPRQGHRLTEGQFSGAPILDNVFDTRAGLNNPIQNVEASGWTFLTEWQITDNLQLRNIFADREDESYSPIDFDSLPTDDLDVPVVYENEQTSNELQFIYSAERWNALLGFFYLDANAFNAFDVILGPTGDLLGLPGLNSFTLGDVDTETWAIFTDVDLYLTDRWTLTLGGRWTEDERTSTVLRQTLIGGTSEFFGGNAIPIATTSDFNGSETFDKFTPRVVLAYQESANHNLYASYSEGFKGGGFDPRGLTTAAPDLDGDGVVSEEEVFQFMKFEPEEVEAFELGWKSTLWGGRMTSAMAVFYNDYKDVQIPGSIGLDADGDGVVETFIGITTNAGKATIKGFEWEGSALLGQDLGRSGADLLFRWALGYIDADYEEFIDITGEDVSDQRVFQNTPEWTASGTLTYTRPASMFNADGVWNFITTLSYRDDTSQFEIPNEFLDQEAYTLWDASILWTTDSQHWQFGIHGKNLTDEEYKVAGYFFPTTGLESNVTAFYGNPRQIWATVEYRWFQ